jgi:hypothetical protein
VGPKGGTNLAPHRGPDTTPTDGLNSNSTGSHKAAVDAAHPLSSHQFVSKILECTNEVRQPRCALAMFRLLLLLLMREYIYIYIYVFKNKSK